MNKFCIITDVGSNHPTIHQNKEGGIYKHIRNREIIKYFHDHINEELYLKKKTICEVLFKFDWGYTMYVVRDIRSGELCVMGEEGIFLYNDNKSFFDRIFK